MPRIFGSASTGGGGTPGGSTTQVQFNNAGAFGGVTGATTNGTFLTLVTPVLGVATGTSLALGGATIGTDLIGAQGSYAKARVASTGALIVQGASVNDLLTFGGTASGTISYASNTLGTHYQLVGDRSGSGGGADLRLGSTALIAFNVNPALNTGALDTGLSRISAGVIGVGTGAAGSIAGGLQAATLALGGATIGSDSLAITGYTAFNGDVRQAAAQPYRWVGRARLYSPVDASLQVSDNLYANSFTVSAPLATASATFQHGALDTASPLAQTIKFQDVVAGTSNTAGVNATIQAPAGTGTGAGGSLIFQVAPAGSSGSAKNPWSTALSINGAGALTINAPATGNMLALGGNAAFNNNGTILAFSGSNIVLNGNGAGTISSGGAISAATASAIPAGGTAGLGYKVSSTANFGVFFGSGAPSLSAAKGSLYLRSDGSGTSDRMYVNTDGSTAWTAVTTAS